MFFNLILVDLILYKDYPMKNKLFFLSITIGLSVLSNADVEISVGSYAKDEIHISTNENSNKIYVHKENQIIDATIGSNAIPNHKFTKEKGIAYYQEKINRYEEKILKYQSKITNYEEKISEKPRKKERYQDKIHNYQDKIKAYQEKISESEIKLKEYQTMK